MAGTSNSEVKRLFREYLTMIKEGQTHLVAWRAVGMYTQPQETQLEVRRLIESMGLL